MQTIANADYADAIALLVNTSKFHNLKRATRDNDLYMNSDKTDSMSFTQVCGFSLSNSKTMKFVNKFIYIEPLKAMSTVPYLKHGLLLTGCFP